MHRPTGGNPLRILIAGLVGLLFGAFGAAEAQDGNVFKILKLEGHQVRWQVPRDGEPRVVTYQLANGAVEFSSARNCRKITNLDELIADSEIRCRYPSHGTCCRIFHVGGGCQHHLP